MSAAAGSIKHLYDDNDLYVSDLINIFKLFGSYKINRDKVEEKFDGTNLFISVVDGEIIIARNKGHLKDFGQGSLRSEEAVKIFFVRLNNVSNAVALAYRELSQIIKQSQQAIDMFSDGRRWINVDIYEKGIQNIIMYPQPYISIHNFNEIDETGEIILTYEYGTVNKLLNLIEPIIKRQSYTYQIFGRKILSINHKKVQESIENLEKRLENIDYLDSIFHTIGKAKCYWWKNLLRRKFNIINEELLKLIVGRFVYENKNVNLNVLKKQINTEYPEQANEIIQYIQSGYKDDEDLVYRPLKELIIDFENLVIQNTTNYINDDDLHINDMVQRSHVKKVVYNLLDNIKMFGTFENKKKIDTNRHYLYHVGINQFKAFEGIVFQYKTIKNWKEKQTYKLTGTFASVNCLYNHNRYNENNESITNTKT